MGTTWEYTTDPSEGALSYEELQRRAMASDSYINPIDYDHDVFPITRKPPEDHPVEWGNDSHPFWHYCKKCVGWVKLGVAFLALDVASEFITFMPIHRFFEWMGWIA